MLKVPSEQILEAIDDLTKINKKGTTQRELIRYLRWKLRVPESIKRDLVDKIRRTLTRCLKFCKITHRAGYYKILTKQTIHQSKDNVQSTSDHRQPIKSNMGKNKESKRMEQILSDDSEIQSLYEQSSLSDLSSTSKGMSKTRNNSNNKHRRYNLRSSNSKRRTRKPINNTKADIRSVKKKNNCTQNSKPIYSKRSTKRKQKKNKNSNSDNSLPIKPNSKTICNKCGKIVTNENLKQSKKRRTMQKIEQELERNPNLEQQVKKKQKTTHQFTENNRKGKSANNWEDNKGQGKPPFEPFTDPFEEPGVNDIEKKDSHHSNPAPPHIGTDNDNDDDDEEGNQNPIGNPRFKPPGFDPSKVFFP